MSRTLGTTLPLANTTWQSTAAALCLSLGMYCATPAHASPQIEALYSAAQAAAKANANGEPSVRSTIADLVRALESARSDAERQEVMAALSQLGQIHGTAEIQLVEIHLPVVAQNPLLNLARNTAMSAPVRKQALQTLRDINARDPIIDKAIALADTDTGTFGNLGAELKDYQRRRDGRGKLSAPAAAPLDPAREAAARQWLNEQHIPINRTSLESAASSADPQQLQALLAAGVNPAPKSHVGMGVLTLATATGCLGDKSGVRDAGKVIEVAKLLVQAGVNINETDDAGNTPLIQAARSCPPVVLTALMQMGAAPNHRNAQGFSALSFVLISNQLASADALIAQGARISKKEADRLFFEAPTDPAMKRTLERAIDNKLPANPKK